MTQQPSLADKLKLRKLIKKLKSFRGRHTELVSVYVPAGYDLVKIQQSLADEQGTATNIKDKNTSKAVINALERLIRTLKVIERTPENGLAIFAGNVSQKDNVDDCQVFWVEPPLPLNQKLYRCDQKFILDPLEEMDANEATYGLVAIDKNSATIGLLVGSTIKVIKADFFSSYPGKYKTGGQSAQRFARIREGAAKDHYNNVAAAMIQEFTYMENLKGIIVGGPGTSKNNFVDGNHLNDEIKKKIIAVKDITYTGEFGLKELVDKSEDVLSEDEIMTEKIAINKFLTTLGTNPMMAAYGYEFVKDALNMGAVEELILIDEILEDDTIEELTQLCENSRSTLTLVTDRTPEGVQLKGLTGIGAILRYPIHT
ncbi:MAG: peptide chain release factor aRF-1 [Nanoarchaeota archaeon]